MRRVRRAARRAWTRTRKAVAQRLRARAERTRVLFVVGVQRSGTTMLLEVLDAHPETRVHHEHDRAAFGPDWRLRPLEVRRRLVSRARCRWLVLKPLFDFQHLDRLLEEHPGSRAIFVYRDPRDAALSSTEKWGASLANVVRRLAHEDACTHWMAERLPAQRRATLREIYHPGLDAASASALRWWLRNEIFFDLGLEARGDRVLPVRYETLAGDPQSGFARIFAFLSLAFDPGLVARVSGRSVGRAREVALEPRVAALCEDLERRLDAVTARAGGAP